MKVESTKEPQEQFANARYIRCPDCGEEIMMVPVLGQMIEAIENHISTHKDHVNLPNHDLPMPHPRAPNIEENLAEQVLTRAAEISDALGKNPTWINRQ
jgi:hypothetical protein